MACSRNRFGRAATANVITDRSRCCAAAETPPQEFYGGAAPEILMHSCPGPNSPSTLDARHRCPYWPRFAHPRWLSCRALYNRYY